jgi:hypothetical protein
MKKIAVLALGVASLFLIYYFVFMEKPDVPATYAQFVSDLTNSNSVFIVMDLRNSTNDTRNPILQCGVDLASSDVLPPRNVSIFVYEGDLCFDASGNRSVSACAATAKTGVQFYIISGNVTSFYRNKLVIGVQNNSARCVVSAANSTSSAPISKTASNSTAPNTTG